MAGTEESHDLVAHGIERQRSLACGFRLHIILDEEGNDIFIFGMCLLVLLAHNVVRFADDDVAALKYVTIHLCRQIFRLWNEGREPMEQTGTDIERENEAIGFTDRGFGVLEGVEISAEASFSDDVQSGSIEPLENLNRNRTCLFNEHVSLPELGQEQGFPPEDGCQSLDGLS